MTDHLLDAIQKLKDEGRGDPGRLNYIIETLKSGKKLYNSDKKYLRKVTMLDDPRIAEIKPEKKQLTREDPGWNKISMTEKILRICFGIGFGILGIVIPLLMGIE